MQEVDTEKGWKRPKRRNNGVWIKSKSIDKAVGGEPQLKRK